jgi:hypothetical protein
MNSNVTVLHSPLECDADLAIGVPLWILCDLLCLACLGQKTTRQTIIIA